MASTSLAPIKASPVEYTLASGNVAATLLVCSALTSLSAMMRTGELVRQALDVFTADHSDADYTDIQ